jgi:hypothetical protein
MNKEEQKIMGGFVKEAIGDFRPHLKESTINSYWANLRKLAKVNNEDTFDFLKDIERVKNSVKDLHYTSQRNTYTAVSTFLLAININGDLDEYIAEYDKMRDALNDRYVEEQKTGVISDKQSPNFITINELEDFTTKLKREVSHEERRGDTNIRMVSLLFEILTRYPLRNDLAGMILTSESKAKKLTDDDKKNANYLVKKGDDFVIIDNIYKTSKKYGEKHIDLTDVNLNKMIRSFIRINKVKVGEVMFPITTNYLSQLLIKYSQKYIQKNISTTMIRKIVSSDKFLEQKEKQEAHANILGHSVGTENQVYIKKQQKD